MKLHLPCILRRCLMACLSTFALAICAAPVQATEITLPTPYVTWNSGGAPIYTNNNDGTLNCVYSGDGADSYVASGCDWMVLGGTYLASQFTINSETTLTNYESGELQVNRSISADTTATLFKMDSTSALVNAGSINLAADICEDSSTSSTKYTSGIRYGSAENNGTLDIQFSNTTNYSTWYSVYGIRDATLINNGSANIAITSCELYGYGIYEATTINRGVMNIVIEKEGTGWHRQYAIYESDTTNEEGADLSIRVSNTFEGTKSGGANSYGIYGKGMSLTNAGNIEIVVTASHFGTFSPYDYNSPDTTYAYGIYGASVDNTGDISIDATAVSTHTSHRKTVAYGINAASVTNTGSITIDAYSSLVRESRSTGLAYGIYKSTLINKDGGELTIHANCNGGNANGIYDSTLINEAGGVVRILSEDTQGNNYGIANSTTTNDGDIFITTNNGFGLYRGDTTNNGYIEITANGSGGGIIYGSMNNNGHIEITADNSGMSSCSLNNLGSINITTTGASTDSSTDGLGVSSTVNNEGTLNIIVNSASDCDMIARGINMSDGGELTNSGQIHITASGSTSGEHSLSVHGVFDSYASQNIINKSGGEIVVDVAATSTTALGNSASCIGACLTNEAGGTVSLQVTTEGKARAFGIRSGRLNNSGVLNIDLNSGYGAVGFYNSGDYSVNHAGGVLNIHAASTNNRYYDSLNWNAVYGISLYDEMTSFINEGHLNITTEGGCGSIADVMLRSSSRIYLLNGSSYGTNNSSGELLFTSDATGTVYLGGVLNEDESISSSGKGGTITSSCGLSFSNVALNLLDDVTLAMDSSVTFGSGVTMAFNEHTLTLDGDVTFNFSEGKGTLEGKLATQEDTTLTVTSNMSVSTLDNKGSISMTDGYSRHSLWITDGTDNGGNVTASRVTVGGDSTFHQLNADGGLHTQGNTVTLTGDSYVAYITEDDSPENATSLVIQGGTTSVNSSTTLATLGVAADTKLSVNGNLTVKGEVAGEAPAAEGSTRGSVAATGAIELGGSASHTDFTAQSITVAADDGSRLTLDSVGMHVQGSEMSLSNVEVRGECSFTSATGALTLNVDGVTFVLDGSNSAASGLEVQPFALFSVDPLTETEVASNVFYIDSSMLEGVNVAGTMTLDLSFWADEIQAGDYENITLAFADDMEFSEGTEVLATLDGQNYAAADYASENTAQFSVASLPIASIPEPTTATLSLLAFTALAARRRRK